MRFSLIAIGLSLLLLQFCSAENFQLAIPKIQERLKIDDFAGMRPRAGLEGKLAVVDKFVQQMPTDGGTPSQKTVVYLAYDDSNIYVIFVCFDKEPKKISAAMTRRENISDSEDWVEVYFDTYNDQRRAYCFSTNALGVQWDSRYSEANGQVGMSGHQPSFDALWYSDGRLTDQGYLIWMAIPFKSMRFPSGSIQKWRTVFGRSIPRTNEYDSWPHVSRSVQSMLHQTSILTGLENVSPGKNMQFIPYASFRSFRLLDTEKTPPGFISDKSDPAVGLDAKFVLKDSFVFDTALNPDFSQVESDQPQVTVNQRFEVFFREKRPFFLENAQYFETPMNLVFTRRIADPQFGGRLTGKSGAHTMGVLFTNDEAPGKLASADSPLSGKNALFSIVRLSRDIGSGSFLGILFTNRSFESATNNVAGIDFKLRLNDRWQATGQAVHSWTRPLDGGTLGGNGYNASLTRTGRQFTYSLTYLDLSPEFKTFVGFIPRTDYRSVTSNAHYYFRPEGKILVAFGPELAVSQLWDYNGTRLDSNMNPSFYVELKRQTYLRLWYYNDRIRIRPLDFPGLPGNMDFAIPGWEFDLNTSYFRKSTISVEYARGKNLNFVPAAGQLPERENSSTLTATLLLRPVERLQLQEGYLFSDLYMPDGATIFNDHIIDSRANYQFTKEFSFRLILQYEATIVNSSLTSLEDRRNFNADFLITYLVNPWTALYVGYNGNRQNLGLELEGDGLHVIRTRGALMNDANQFFVKFSYLMRF